MARLTGMPAWGDAQRNEESWKFLHFVRYLPHLTPAEEREMEKLNPKSRHDLKEEEDEEKFLNQQ
jgi:hypothetical protein